MTGPQSSLRLLFDESLPWTVAGQLRDSGYDVSWVDDRLCRAPEKGAPDSEVLRYAMEQGFVIVTTDRGFVLTCIEGHRSVIWISPYGRQSNKQLKGREKQRLILSEIDKWAQYFAEGEHPMCVRVLAKGSQTMSLEEATALLRRQKRSRTLRPRKTSRAREKPTDVPGLPFPSDKDHTAL